LSLCRRRQGHTREQCSSTEEKLESAHFFDPLKVSAVPCIALDPPSPITTIQQQQRP
jgi:hypothetical protein